MVLAGIRGTFGGVLSAAPEEACAQVVQVVPKVLNVDGRRFQSYLIKQVNFLLKI